MPSEDGQHPREAESQHQPFEPLLSDTVEMDALQIEPYKPVRPALPSLQQIAVGTGAAVWVSIKSPAKQSDNEDAVAAFSISIDRGLLVVADGLGGHRGGKSASQSVVRGLTRAFRKVPPSTPTEIVISGGLKVPIDAPPELDDGDYRKLILDQIESANRRLVQKRTGGATTLALAEVSGNRVRTYHVGDSPVLIVSQRGQIKHETVVHSPIGYAVEAGLLSEQEAIYHEQRHLVSNVVGARDMTVELGSWVPLAPRDTVLLASDGLFDNLMTYEIVDRIRTGSLLEGVRALAELALDRMVYRNPQFPSKPDDLTILAYRRLPPSSSRSVKQDPTRDDPLADD